MAHSLKEKRMVVQRLRERLRGKFNVAVAELEHQELWQRAGLGVVSISSSEQNVRQVLEGALAEAERCVAGHAEISGSGIELL